jgi:N-acetylglucosamine malate deacetylase 1
LLAGKARDHAASWSAAGWNVALATPDVDLGVAAGSCDVVVAEDVLAHDPWDRWALQRFHRALKCGGILELSEPNRLDLATFTGWAYVVSRGAREIVRALRRRLGVAAAPRPSLAGRRPSPGALARLLAGLRFAGVAAEFDRTAGWGRLLPPSYAARFRVVARARPSLPGYDDAWPARADHERSFHAAQSHLLAIRERFLRARGAAPPAAVRPFDAAEWAGRTVLVLAPHPDDEVIGAGGAILRLVAAGARVVVVQATDGSAGASLEGLPEGERREVRLREAAAVAQRLGVAAVEWWREDNAHFRVTPAAVTRLRALLERERPALVFVPFPTDTHPDHVTLARILAEAVAAPGLDPGLMVLGYEVWSLVPPTHVHDITPLMKDIESTFFLYDQAMRIDDFVHFCGDRALAHGYAVAGRPAYLEAFHGVPAREFPALVAAARELADG